MSVRIGIFICECGPNIKEAIHLDELCDFGRRLKGVVFVEKYNLLCSGEGTAWLQQTIKEHDLDRIVVAACSPKEHEHTFSRALQQSGRNPYMMQMVNIREQCAWVTRDRGAATRKAGNLLRAAVNRVVHHDPLETRQIECNADVLVVGAGVAGVSAALTLAQKNRRVYLVEKSPCIGGKVPRYEEVFPSLECASCMMSPRLDDVLHHESITLLTQSEVQQVLGFYGNFHVQVRTRARHVDPAACIGCSACFEPCPVEVDNEYSEGLDKRKAVYLPYAGALPNVAAIDPEHCLRYRGEACELCRDACPFGAIDYEAQEEIVELHVGAVILASGFASFDVRERPQYGYGEVENVYTAPEFERLCCSTGPTGGELCLKDGSAPGSVALIHCVGSREPDGNAYCSGICCTYLLKFAKMIRTKLPGTGVTLFHSGLCLPGKKAWELYNSLARDDRVSFVSMHAPHAIEARQSGGCVGIEYVDRTGVKQCEEVQMAVLAPAVVPGDDAGALARIFEISRDASDGFFVEEHDNLAPVSTTTEGIYIAGCTQGPKDVQSSVTQGEAAAGKILGRLLPGEKLTVEAVTAQVREDLCSGCRTCVSVCPYKAITYVAEESRAEVNRVLCRGCGSCVAACPSGAATALHFTEVQVLAEIEGLLDEG